MGASTKHKPQSKGWFFSKKGTHILGSAFIGGFTTSSISLSTVPLNKLKEVGPKPRKMVTLKEFLTGVKQKDVV